MTDVNNRSPEQIESEIAATRRSLDRKLNELGHRLDPRERIEEVKARAAGVVASARDRAASVLDGSRDALANAGESLHPRNFEPYVGWMAIGAVVGGTVMAVNGWRRLQCRSLDGADEVAIGSDVTIVSTSDLADLPPAP